MSNFSTDKQECLCCMQRVLKPGRRRRTLVELEHGLAVLEAMGYTRDELLTKHRAQCEYQFPGFVEWLRGQ